ncbi:MAG: hypothetical protein WCJ03_06735 [Bacteroidales bacterium]
MTKDEMQALMQHTKEAKEYLKKAFRKDRIDSNKDTQNENKQ